MTDEPTISPEPANDPERRRRFEAVLGAYFEALDAGQSPDRQELLTKHPELAAELAEFFAQQDLFHRLVAPVRPEETEAGESAARPSVGFTELGVGDPKTSGTLPLEQGAGNLSETQVQLSATVRDSPGPVQANGNGIDLPQGTRIRYFGDYELGKELGRGGMGVVFRARQVSLNRPVALKMIKAGFLADGDEMRRFQNEAEAIALLDHGGIVPIYEVGEHNGQRYFSMKLVDGGNLVDRLAAYRHKPRAAAELLVDVAEAVHHAHMRGILHRDLKPANILVDDQGHPHVTDFGLARKVGGDSEMTATGVILGTPSYMSPEQASGRRRLITIATDVYGLGSILYTLLTGRAPFAGESVVDTLTRVREQPPEPPRKLNAGVPRDLEVITLKCLQKDPRRRYPSAQAVADDLRAWLESRPIAARPVGTLTRARLWCQRRPAVAGLSAAVVLVTLAGLAFGASQWSAALRSAEVARENADRATANAGLAVANAKEAQARSSELAASNQALRRTTYASVMRLAQREWERGSVGIARKLLGSLQPSPGQDDLRSFDWSFLQRQCGASLLTIPVPGAPPQNFGRSVSFSVDGRRLAVTLWEELAVFDTATGREAYRVTGGPYLDAAFSPCGRYMATLTLEVKGHVEAGSAATQKLTVLDATSYKPLRSVSTRTGFRGCLEFSPDGNRVAVKTLDSGPTAWLSALAIFETGTGAEVRALYDAKGIDGRPAFSPEGKLLASETGYNTISIWDAATGRLTRSILDPTAGMIRAVEFSPDGTRLASIGDDGRAKIWDVETGRTVLALRVADQNGYALQYSPDGMHLVTVNSEGIARVWDAESGELLFLIRGVDNTVVYSPDGLRLASYGDGETVRLWDATGEMQASVVGPLADPIYSLAVSAEGELLATGDGSVWDAKTLARRYRLEAPDGVSWGEVEFSPDGRQLAVGGGRISRLGEPETQTMPGTVRVVEAASGRELFSFSEPRGFAGEVVFCPDGRWLVSSSGVIQKGKGWATLRDAATGRPLRDLEGFVQGRNNVAFRPDSRVVAYGGAEALLVRGVEDGAEVLTIKGLGGSPLSVSFSPDGRRILAEIRKPDQSEEIRIWDAQDGREELTIPAPMFDTLNRVIFSPDGKRLATADFRALVRVWDAISGNELLTLKGHTSWVWSLAFSPDGTRLYSGSRDRTVRVWRADTPAAVRAPEASGLLVDPARIYTQAVMLGQRAQYDKAQVVWRRFLEIARQRHQEGELSTLSAESQLGECLTRLGRPGDAERLLIRSYQQARSTPSAVLSPEILTDFCKRIIAFYEVSGQPDRAAFWRAEELDATFPAYPFTQ